MTHIEVNASAARSCVAATRNLINTQLLTKIVRYRQLANRLNMSRGLYRDECVQALLSEAATLESVRRVYATTLQYLENATSTIESQDQILSKSIENIKSS